MNDTKTMNKALVDIFRVALEWETDLPIRDQILKLAQDAIPTTAQIMVAFNKEQTLKARTERLEKALDFCKINNHKDNWGGKTYCRGHECPVCAKIEEAKAVLEEVKK